METNPTHGRVTERGSEPWRSPFSRSLIETPPERLASTVNGSHDPEHGLLPLTQGAMGVLKKAGPALGVALVKSDG